MRLMFAAFLLTLCSLAQAHDTPHSSVFIDVRDEAIALELHLPVNQLKMALFSGQTQQALPESSQISTYIAEHISASSPQQNYQVKVDSLQADREHPEQLLIAQVRLLPDSGQVDSFQLDYQVILKPVVSHKIFVSLRSDFKRAIFNEQQPQPLGVLRYQHSRLDIDLSQRSLWHGFASLFNTGMQHIAGGFDHLLFLLVLLLPAPLLMRRNAHNKARWGEPASLRHSLWTILKIVSAFTLGHSLTLLLGALGLLSFPAQWVESLVALSILVSALHAVRPIISGYEARVAIGFGLIHGLAFASELHQLGYDWQTLLTSVFAFNLGIEAMQLAIVLLVMPSLLMLSCQPRLYPAVRIIGASFAGIAATSWLLERTLEINSFFEPVVEWVFAHGTWGILGLAALAMLSWIQNRRSQGFA